MSHTSRPDSGSGSGPAGSGEERPLHFIEQIVEADNASSKWGLWKAGEATSGQREGAPRVHTRFPPEPNGYLHVGHAKSICLNYGLAERYAGKFNLRFDDTNPSKEEMEYVESIKRDVKWLGGAYDGPFGGGLYWASDYFQAMYDFAVELVRKGRAYVCQLTADEVSSRRGSPGVPATSPFRDRPIEESLRLFAEMREGKHPNGAMTLRAKIDLASPNFNLRDPVMYRILHEAHHNTGTAWCIYPMYDWAHGIEDSLEGITHSICTLEFEDHRPLYDWFIGAINEGRGGPGQPAKIHHPQQIEFAKYRPTYTVLSKRNLLRMVQSGIVRGWDDPRMPTVAGIRRRGYTPEAIRALCRDVGVTKVESSIDVVRQENAVREHLNKVAPRAMGVLRPLRVVIENWPEDRTDLLDFVVNPEAPGAGTRKIPFTREIYIEQDDFMENPPKKFFRLAPGAEVRLRWAYFLTCTGVEKDATGRVVCLRATIDPATRGGDAPPGPDGKPSRKVKGTIHWVSAKHAVEAEVRLYDRLFSAEEPGKRTGKWEDDLNPASLETVRALVDPWLASPQPEEPEWADGIRRFQLERLGYFCVDPDSTPQKPVLNRTTTLRDSWAKDAAQG
ncbi:MAG: glutamine--tRNA ligase/YqeY domain fusion protein [Leptolyngbya sp. PLA1]|nr:glutamine--tRNA ligase/YqeY domain fusion protein [Leptolyngbya sp. PLA1]